MIDPPPTEPPIVPLTAECVQTVSDAYGLHMDILYAYLMVEGGTVGEDSRANDNGTKDIGIAQINTIHLEELKEFGITEQELRNDACLNLAVAARYAVRVVLELRDSPITARAYLEALARYHSKTPEMARIYADRLEAAFDLLYAQPEDVTYP